MADVQIGSIRIRTGAVPPEQGRQLGDRVAVLLTEELADGNGARRNVAHLQASVTAVEGQTVEQLAAQVVAAIMQAL